MSGYTLVPNRLNTRFSELKRSTLGSVQALVEERHGLTTPYSSPIMEFGTIRHEQLAEESLTTGKLPLCFNLDEPVDAVEQAWAAEVIPGVVIHCRPDAVWIGGGVLTDYKGLALDTALPTPEGWTTMGEVQVGDQIIGGDGKPCRVSAKSEVHLNPCYRVTMSDGTSVVADHEHLWQVLSNKGDELMTTEQMAANLYTWGKHRQLRIPLVGVELPEAKLLVDPYVFGAWLGDGTRSYGQICKPLEPLFDEIRKRGYEVSTVKNPKSDSRTVYGLQPKLREIGALGFKHIPTAYMRASYSQRLDLLRGLMDTDGHWNVARKRCVINTTDKRMADDINELVCSLGWSAKTLPYIARGFGLVKRAYYVCFTPYGHEVFLARKPVSYRINPPSVRSRRRIVWSVEKVPTIATQCIQVDSPEATFLCTKQLLRTHNTASGAGDVSLLAKAKYGSDMQLNVYAYLLSIHGIRITKRRYLVEAWDVERTRINGYSVFEAPVTDIELAKARKWLTERARLLVIAESQFEASKLEATA